MTSLPSFPYPAENRKLSFSTQAVTQLATWLQHNPPFLGNDLIQTMIEHLGATLHEFSFQKYYGNVQTYSAFTAIVWNQHYWYQNKPFSMDLKGLGKLEDEVGRGYTHITLLREKALDEAVTQQILDSMISPPFAPELEEKRVLWKQAFLANLEKMHLETVLPTEHDSPNVSKPTLRL